MATVEILLIFFVELKALLQSRGFLQKLQQGKRDS